jgi:hypothetical protein
LQEHLFHMLGNRLKGNKSKHHKIAQKHKAEAA